MRTSTFFKKMTVNRGDLRTYPYFFKQIENIGGDFKGEEQIIPVHAKCCKIKIQEN